MFDSTLPLRATVNCDMGEVRYYVFVVRVVQLTLTSFQGFSLYTIV